MSYQVIARKWRPQSFQQLVGQDHVSQTLQNALRNGRIHHALLFTGPRGTGKTSSARILAKSIRCPDAVDFVPCEKCSSCLEISQGRSVDVVEIDGASNNGVDAIRDLRETVGYMPAFGKYKVYIIDEVHMLSTSAFNALLKTLEEPPEHVIFVLATTEVHKIPATILSRCQRYDFRRIPTRQISDRLKFICDSENVQVEADALWILARQGDGSMRDSQSLLDQVITFSNGAITRDKVIEILGLTDRMVVVELLACLVARDLEKTLNLVARLNQSGSEPTIVATELLESIRNLLLIKVSALTKTNITGVPGSAQANIAMLDLPDSELRFLTDLAGSVAEEDIHMLFDMSLKGLQDLGRGAEPRMILEMLLLRMAQAPRVRDIVNLVGAGAAVAAAPAGKAVPTRPSSAATVTNHAPMAAAAPAAKRTVDPVGVNPAERWLDCVQLIRNSDALFAAKVEGLIFVGLRGKVIDLALPEKLMFMKSQIADPEVQKKLQGFVDQSWGAGYTFELKVKADDTKGAVTKGVSAQAMEQKKIQAAEADTFKSVSEHPKVKAATQIFKGQIKNVKDIK